MNFSTGLGPVKTLWRTPESLQPPPLQLGPFVLQILAVLSPRRRTGAQFCRFGRHGDRWGQLPVLNPSRLPTSVHALRSSTIAVAFPSGGK
jgi:hypothetical protein